jgi:hypothetical protein
LGAIFDYSDIESEVWCLTREKRINVMTEAETREYEQTRLRVKYNNSWPSEKWISPLQEELLARMDKEGLKQVFYPMALDESRAVDILFEDAELNRLLSTLLDLYDELPLRPDAAFDVAWRALEIVIMFYFKNYDKQVYNDKKASTEEKIKRVCNAVFESQLTANEKLMDVFNRLIGDNVSWSVLHYIVARMFLPGELQVKTQHDYVSTRCREILGVDMYDDIKTKYVVDETAGIVVLDVIPNKELISELIWFRDDVEVLSPESLREEIKEIIARMHQKYNSVKNGCTTEP